VALLISFVIATFPTLKTLLDLNYKMIFSDEYTLRP
jgi:hypothetical protein